MTGSCFSCAAGTANVNNICCNINSPATCYIYPKEINPLAKKRKKKPLKKRKPSFTVPGRWRYNGGTWREYTTVVAVLYTNTRRDESWGLNVDTG
jgi:hypothetical protein